MAQTTDQFLYSSYDLHTATWKNTKATFTWLNHQFIETVNWGFEA